MKNNWLWDKDITEEEVKVVLSNISDKKFISYAALLLSRNNSAKEVFSTLLKKEDFFITWNKVKKQMRKNAWNDPRIEYWQAIYDTLKEERPEFKKLKPPASAFSISDLFHFSIAKEIGSKIKLLREKSGLTQKDLAKKLGISQQIISRLEGGRQNVSIETLSIICGALGVPFTAEKLGFHFEEKQEKTGNTYPFSSKSPEDFVKIVFEILERSKEFNNVQYYDGTGDKGRDIIAYKYSVGKKEQWYFQCKRYTEISFSDFKEELDKINKHSREDKSFKPDGIIFVTACKVSAQCKDSTKAYASKIGLGEVIFWTDVELTAKAKTVGVYDELFPIIKKDLEKKIKELKSLRLVKKGRDEKIKQDFQQAPIPTYFLEGILKRPYADILSSRSWDELDFTFELTLPDISFEDELLNNLEKSEALVFDYASLLNLSKMNLLGYLEKFRKGIFVSEKLFIKIQDELLQIEQEDLRNLWRFLKDSKTVHIAEGIITTKDDKYDVLLKGHDWIIDSLLLAKEKKAVFVIDDLVLLKLFQSEEGIKGANSLIILRSLLNRGWIDGKIYATSIGDLAERFYTFLPFSGEDLFQIVMEDRAKISLRAKHLVNEISLPGSVANSFTAVFVRFIELLWSTGSLPENKVDWLSFLTEKIVKLGEEPAGANNKKELEQIDSDLMQMWVIAIQKSGKDEVLLLEARVNKISENPADNLFKENISRFIQVKKESFSYAC